MSPSDLPARPDYRHVLIRLGELCLKGQNRQMFTRALRRNLKSTVCALDPGARVRVPHRRAFVDLADCQHIEPVLQACCDTPGITSVSPVRRADKQIQRIVEAAVELATIEWGGANRPAGDTDGRSFAVKAQRMDKRFSLTSPEIGRVVGGEIQEALGLDVNLKKPDLTLGIEVASECVYLWVRRLAAVGGLPVGTAGRVTLLLSGGIDSPVAGYLAQKRGCELDAVYFHSPPFTGEETREKVETLGRVLAARQGALRLFVVRFTEIQKAIKLHCEPAHTVLLYRRFMYRIAARIADQRRSIALCTGESLGQVASQTLQNLRVVDKVTDALTLRPVLTYDKQEIIRLARQLGTYETSILPYDDCCTLFVPTNPTIRGHARTLQIQEQKLELTALIDEALAATQVYLVHAGGETRLLEPSG